MKLYYIYKIASSKLMENAYDIKDYVISDARANKELISIGNNQVFEFIKTINKSNTNFEHIKQLYKSRDKLKKKDGNYDKIIKLQSEIDSLLLFKEIINVQVDNKNAYKYIRARNRGFKFNGQKYVRLCCGAGQARRNTVTFVSENIYSQLNKILMNGLNIKEINIAKFNAYFGLYMSAIDKVDTPRVCLIDDCELELINKKIDWVEDKSRMGLDNVIEEYRDIEEKTMNLTMNVCDGQGLISPIMAKTWSDNLGLDYTGSQFIIRTSFMKGCLATFDFHKFAKDIAKTDKITDHYGKEWNIEEIDVLISLSQFKMYKYYTSWDEYIENCTKNGHFWGVAKPNKKTDNEYSLFNYQYVQNLVIEQDDIEKLSQYTIEWLKNICSGDELYSKLFLMGIFKDDTEYNTVINKADDTFIKAILYNSELLKDNYVQNKIYRLIENKIQEAKIGRLYVKGNYQVMVADPYLQCESAFRFKKPQGLLKEFEDYSQFWLDKGIKKVDACRSPMVDFSEHNVLNFIDNANTRDWYQYCSSGIIYNCWGLDTIIHSDSDFDGDIVFTTDNDIVLKCIKPNCNPITYAKSIALPMKLREANITKSDLQSFNCSVGRTTNYSTIFDSMICNFKNDSEEYKELINRKKTLRRYIGDSIDAAKGIKTKNFPRSWKKFIKFDKENDSEVLLKQKYFQNKLVAKKKPFFMIYIYESLLNEYRTYINTERISCFENHGVKLKELKSKENKSLEEKDFLRKYYKNMPLTTYNCIVNKLCWHLEGVDKELKNTKVPRSTSEYIESMINKNIKWDEEKYKNTKLLFRKFGKEKSIALKNMKLSIKNKDNKLDSLDEENNEFDLDNFYEKYRGLWLEITTNETEFANYAFKISYTLNKNKDFLWCLAFNGLISNLKSNFNKYVKIPVECLKEDGVEYLGQYYKLKNVLNPKIKEVLDDSI